MFRQCAPWINTPPKMEEVGLRWGKRERTKTKFQTCNLSNPQSCENDWGEKGEERRGEDGGQGVR